jgi:hypothetical protein
MKEYVNIKDVGVVGQDDTNFIVCDYVKQGKTATKFLGHPAYFGLFVQAMKELHERFLIKKLANSKTEKDLKAFIAKVEALEVEWREVVNEFNLRLKVKEEE